MALWLVRAGASGEFEARFLSENRIFFNWSGLAVDLSQLENQEGFYRCFAQAYPRATKGKVQNNARQARQFAQGIAPNDIIVLPSKFEAAIHVGRVSGPYVFDGSAPDKFQHHREVEWVAPSTPRDAFEKDLLNSFGAFLTVCQITRNNAEERVRRMVGLPQQSPG